LNTVYSFRLFFAYLQVTTVHAAQCQDFYIYTDGEFLSHRDY